MGQQSTNLGDGEGAKPGALDQSYKPEELIKLAIDKLPGVLRRPVGCVVASVILLAFVLAGLGTIIDNGNKLVGAVFTAAPTSTPLPTLPPRRNGKLFPPTVTQNVSYAAFLQRNSVSAAGLASNVASAPGVEIDAGFEVYGQVGLTVTIGAVLEYISTRELKVHPQAAKFINSDGSYVPSADHDAGEAPIWLAYPGDAYGTFDVRLTLGRPGGILDTLQTEVFTIEAPTPIPSPTATMASAAGAPTKTAPPLTEVPTAVPTSIRPPNPAAPSTTIIRVPTPRIIRPPLTPTPIE